MECWGMGWSGVGNETMDAARQRDECYRRRLDEEDDKRRERIEIYIGEKKRKKEKKRERYYG